MESQNYGATILRHIACGNDIGNMMILAGNIFWGCRENVCA